MLIVIGLFQAMKNAKGGEMKIIIHLREFPKNYSSTWKLHLMQLGGIALSGTYCVVLLTPSYLKLIS